MNDKPNNSVYRKLEVEIDGEHYDCFVAPQWLPLPENRVHYKDAVYTGFFDNAVFVGFLDQVEDRLREKTYESKEEKQKDL